MGHATGMSYTKHHKISLVLMLGTLVVWGQQDPQFSQYMLNKAVFNPAYTGSHPNSWISTLTYRKNWLGFAGSQAPQNTVFNTNLPFGRKRAVQTRPDPLGVGLTIISEQLGIENRMYVQGALAYHIRFKRAVMPAHGDWEMFFGMNFGFMKYQLTGRWDPQNSGDPLIQNLTSSVVSPDLGTGIMIKNEKYNFGLSASHLTQSAIEYSGLLLAAQARHYFATGSVNFQNDPEKMIITPSFLAKYAQGAPPQFDLNLKCTAPRNEAFWAAIGYRYQDALSAMVGLNIADWGEKKQSRDKKRMLAFSYDYNISSVPGDFSNGSYELILIFDLSTEGLRPPSK